jgi:outer membrane receptor for ferrienterochelin and colicin
LGGRSASAGANVGQTLLTGGLAAARTQQAGAGFSPEAGLLYGLANSPRLQTGFENAYNNYTMNRNIEGALPQSANPFGNPMSAADMDRMSYGYY